jgi:hypothetical protein
MTEVKELIKFRSFAVTKIIPTFAIMACLASSLAFASDKSKSASDSATMTAAATSDNTAPKDDGPCGSAKDTNQERLKTKPAPSNQEREFDRVLLGIYG